MGGYGAALEGLITTLPLESTNMRMVVASKNGGKRQGMLSTMHEIVQQEGILAFYKSLAASMVLCINPAITYGAFEAIKGWLLRGRNAQVLGTFEAFVVGVVSKIIATTITFPAIRAKVLINTRFKSVAGEGNAALGLAGTMQRIVASEGLGGLYVGLGPQMVKG